MTFRDWCRIFRQEAEGEMRCVREGEFPLAHDIIPKPFPTQDIVSRGCVPLVVGGTGLPGLVVGSPPRRRRPW